MPLPQFGDSTQSTGTIVSVQPVGYTVATLPAGAQGDSAFVTDALTPVFLDVVVGGGAIVVRVFHNGTSWTVQ